MAGQQRVLPRELPIADFTRLSYGVCADRVDKRGEEPRWGRSDQAGSNRKSVCKTERFARGRGRDLQSMGGVKGTIHARFAPSAAMPENRV